MSLLTGRRRGTRRRVAPTAQETPAGGPARGRRWRLLAVLLVPAALLWFLPAIVAHTPLLGWIVAKAAAELNGTVTVGSASLGWFSPITAQGVEVCDEGGQPVLLAPKLAGNKSLAAILWNWSRLGRFRLEGPELTVVLRDDGSNVEDLLANYLVPSDQPSTLDVTLEVVDGSVSVADHRSQRTWQIEQLQLSVSTSAEADTKVELRTSAVVTDAARPGRLAAGLTLQPSQADGRPPVTTYELKLESDEFPLAMLRSLMARFAPQTHVAGYAGCKVEARWDDDPASTKLAVQADVTARDFTLSAPCLGTDRLQLAQLRAACQVTRQAGRVELKESSVDCDLGQASVRGTLEPRDWQSGSLVDALLHQTYEVEGRIDLARLARVLPATLRIRRQTEITSGQVRVALSSGPSPQGPDRRGMAWQARIEASDLTAAYDGRPLAWEKPIVLTLAAHDSQQGPVIETLRCESDFLELHATGTPSKLAASANVDLGQLADQLGQFVDLGGLRLGGDGWAHLNWSRSAQQQFEADASLQLRGFQLAMPHQKPWKEDDLRVSVSASGRTDLGAHTQVDTASLEIKTAADHVRAQLAQPVNELSGGGTWPVDLEAQGQLENWPARLATWVAVDDWDTAGTYNLSARAAASTGRVSVEQANLELQQFRLRTPSLNIVEPTLTLRCAGNWDRRAGRLQLEPAALSTESLSIQASRVALQMPEQGPLQIAATMKYEGDLQRLQQWITNPAGRPTWQVAGRFSGTAELVPTDSPTDAQLGSRAADRTATSTGGSSLPPPVGSATTAGSIAGITVRQAAVSVEQFKLRTSSLDIAEPNVRLSFSGSCDPRRRRLRLEPVSLTSRSLTVRAAHIAADLPAEAPPQIDADVEFQAGLWWLHQWINDPTARPGWYVAGQVSGTARLAGVGGLTDGQIEADVANLFYKSSSGRQFKEPQIHLAARGSYEHQAALLQLEQLDVTTEALAARTAGRIARANDRTELQLAGQIDYDLEKLVDRLRPYLGSSVQIVGRSTSPASYRGPLELSGAEADANIRWQRADAYGFQMGPGELKAGLANGVLRSEPLDLAVNGGRLLLAPQLRLAPEPMLLTLPSGPLVKQVQITPAMCAAGLKYIAPVLADVSTAQGTFSIDLDGCRIPLDDPTKGELAGRFTIHSVEVGPGPLVRELAVLLGRAAPARLRRESVVPFRLVDGRVYHRDLELVFPDLTIRTYGSVGLDQTLALMAEMSVPPKWLGNNVLGSALRNQTIRLPIGGTLSKPKIDQRELERVSQQFLENAARNVIEDEVNRQLDRLFGPPR